MAIQSIIVPDIGGPDSVTIVEIMVAVGTVIKADDPILTLESDKATMEVPSPFAGTIQSLAVKVGDTVKEGSVIATIDTVGAAAVVVEVATTPAPAAPVSAPAAVHVPDNNSAIDSNIHASPIVRRIASEFDIDLNRVRATGPKGRITKEDVQAYVKQALASNNHTSSALPKAPEVDFSKFGEIERKSLNRIKKLTGTFLSRNWLLVPHVTQFEEADITDLEAFRQSQRDKGVKLTPIVFIMKAVVAALKAYPQFNASLSVDGNELILKKYFHIGVAVDTPEGLVVPVIRDVNSKGLLELAQELTALSAKAKEGKLLPKDMQGACFTISSLGGIGGTAFTPIVNMPEVAILGVSKSQMKPVYENGQFVPRLMLPLSLSYDHRVIDGAEGARFIVHIANLLADMRQLVL